MNALGCTATLVRKSVPLVSRRYVFPQLDVLRLHLSVGYYNFLYCACVVTDDWFLNSHNLLEKLPYPKSLSNPNIGGALRNHNFTIFPILLFGNKCLNLTCKQTNKAGITTHHYFIFGSFLGSHVPKYPVSDIFLVISTCIFFGNQNWMSHLSIKLSAKWPSALSWSKWSKLGAFTSQGAPRTFNALIAFIWSKTTEFKQLSSWLLCKNFWIKWRVSVSTVATDCGKPQYGKASTYAKDVNTVMRH